MLREIQLQPWETGKQLKVYWPFNTKNNYCSCTIVFYKIAAGCNHKLSVVTHVHKHIFLCTVTIGFNQRA